MFLFQNFSIVIIESENTDTTLIPNNGNLGASIESLASQCGGATAPGKLAEIIKTAVTVTSTVNPGETSTSEEASGNAITLSEGALSAGGDDAHVQISL